MNPAGRAGAESGVSQDRYSLVEQLLALSEEAAEAVDGFTEANVELAGMPVRLLYAGAAVSEPLLPALEHLRIDPPDRPALTVRVWDGRSTSTPAPVAAWGPEAFGRRGAIDGFFGDGFFTLWEEWLPALHVADAERGLGFFWIEDAGSLEIHHRSAPLRTLVNLWLSESDIQLVHGAAVGREDGCVLLVGPSGAGKTSSALSCIDSDLLHLGEDYCLAAPGAPPTVWSIYSSAKMLPASLSRLPGLRELVVAMPEPGDMEGKALLDLHARAPEKMIRTAPLRAILIPRVTGERETRVSPGTAGAALSAVGPSTMLQLPGNGPSAMTALSSIVQAVPVHRLDAGTDPAGIPAAIERILDAA